MLTKRMFLGSISVATSLLFANTLLGQAGKTPAASGPAAYVIDKDHTKVEFEVPHLVFSSVKGTFKEFEGEITFDEADFTKNSFKGSANTASVNTENEKRDKHLRSADFFDAAKYPKITFVSKRSEKTGDKSFKLIGDLTIHGKTKEVPLEMRYLGKVTAFGKERTGFKGEAKIVRQDFGMNFSTLADSVPLVGDEVTIMLTIEAIRK